MNLNSLKSIAETVDPWGCHLTLEAHLAAMEGNLDRKTLARLAPDMERYGREYDHCFRSVMRALENHPRVRRLLLKLDMRSNDIGGEGKRVTAAMILLALTAHRKLLTRSRSREVRFIPLLKLPSGGIVHTSNGLSRSR